METTELTWGDREVPEWRLLAMRQAVLDVHSARFGTVPADMEVRVARAEEPDLRQLLRQAVLVARPEDLLP